MIADPRAVAARWPVPRVRALAELACVTTEAPWALSRAHHDRARAAGLDDDEVLHAIALAAFFGHLNRIADAVDVPLDYRVRREPPRPERAVPPFLPAPAPVTPQRGISSGQGPPRAGGDRSPSVTGERAITLARREATAAALAAWMEHAARPRDAPASDAPARAGMTRDRDALDGHRRAMIATRVGRLVGDFTGDAAPRSELDHALLALADRLTLAPWTIDEASYAPLRAAGWSDRDVFDACAVASAAGVFSRIEVALIAIGR